MALSGLDSIPAPVLSDISLESSRDTCDISLEIGNVDLPTPHDGSTDRCGNEHTHMCSYILARR